MAFITDFAVFLGSVMVISLSGVLLPGPLFAVTIEKAAKRKTAGVLIALGHGIVEFPLMFLIFFLLSEFEVPLYVQIGIGLFGGLIMILMGMQTFKNRNKIDQKYAASMQDSLIAGIRTTAFNPGFLLWWLTVGTTLILDAKLFGLVGFTVFAGVHWSIDLIWYAIVAIIIYKSHKKKKKKVHQGITFFCVTVLAGFGAYFFVTALWHAISIIF